METLLLTILKQGSLAFIGSKITKVMGQKEISELISAGGWSIIGISAVENVVLPVIDWVGGVSDSIGGFFDKIEGIGESFKNLPF